MHRVIILLIGTLLVAAAPAAAQEPFTDVDPDAYYADSVGWMISEGLTTGSAAALYRPDDPVTRGETAVFLWRLMGEPSAPVHPFGDVTVGWQDSAIAWMYQADISRGVSPTRFDPGGVVSRGSLAIFLWRAAGEPSAPSHDFTDVDDPVLHAPVSWVSAKGISTGIEPAVFGPGTLVTRGQIAVFLQRAAEQLPDQAPEVESGREEGGDGEEESDIVPDVELEVSSSTPRVGERLRIHGSGFDGDVLIALDDEIVARATPGPEGSFSAETSVPEGPARAVSVTAFQGGVAVASVDLLVREAPPTIGPWFPLLVIGVVLAAVGVWWRRQRRAESVAAPADVADGIEAPPDMEPAPARAVEDQVGAIEVAPIGLDTVGPIETLSTYDGRVWGTARSGFEGVEHAIVVAVEGYGADFQMAADLGPGAVDAVAVSGRDAIAVGGRHVRSRGGSGRLPTLWHTSDLRSWMHVDLAGTEFAEAVFDGVTSLGERLVLHGRSAAGPSVWIGSPSGWRTISMPGPVDCLAATGKGILAFGRDLERRSAVLLASRDAVGMAPVTHPSVSAFDAATILSVVDFEGGLVAAGFDNLRGTAAVFVSDDGLQWHRAPADFTEGSGIEAVIAFDDLLIAIGSNRLRAHAAKGSDLALWSSSDAITWEPVDPGRVGVASRAVAAVGTENGVVVSGVRSVGSGRSQIPVIWRLDPHELVVPAR